MLRSLVFPNFSTFSLLFFTDSAGSCEPSLPVASESHRVPNLVPHITKSFISHRPVLMRPSFCHLLNRDKQTASVVYL